MQPTDPVSKSSGQDTAPATTKAQGDGGLTSAEAAERLRAEGPNVLGKSHRRGLLAIAASQFASPLVLLLVAASFVSVAVGDVTQAGIILVIIAMSAALGFGQEARSEAAVAALQARLTLQATVVRDGREQDVPMHDVVRGDLVVLTAGDIIPADGRITEANHLYVDESSLTGESAPGLKAPRAGELDPARDGDREGLVFFGTSVVSGSGRALISATGARTSYGAIAHRLTERAPQTDFQLGVRAFGLLIARVTIILVVAVFAINIALQRPLLESLLFSIALAVGLTPELLPAIVTLNLTRGARGLAAHGVLVKRLPAIQNLGSLTILCTDKTGTLTEGRLKLVRSSGIDRDDAAEASHALELGYLNSHFQAGFVNPLDAALLAGAPAPADLAAYRKLAELPYDFERRLLSVVVQHGDTALVQYGIGTFGSRATAVGGTALYFALQELKKKIKLYGGMLLKSEDVSFAGGVCTCNKTGATVSLPQIAGASYRAMSLPPNTTPGLHTSYFWEPPNFTFPFGAHIAVTEVDRDTGDIQIKRYVAVDDCGNIVNPLIVAGQIHGGVAQGLGQAIYEQAVYDDDGQLISGEFTDYTVPKAAMVPNIETEHTVTPSPVNPLGVKGVGEAGTIGASPALVNSVVDALSPLGVRHIDMPMTPERIWNLIQKGAPA